MSRSVAWRRQVSDAISWYQDQALSSTIYILRETGPTGFLLKEENENKKFKVYLGDPHTCTCAKFIKERELCKHICWVLLKKFRVPRQNPITWQIGLVEREINELIRGIQAAINKPKPKPAASGRSTTSSDVSEAPSVGSVEQRPIAEDDVCPICQEEFMDKHLPVTYCKFGCGNSVHVKCMKVWANHQRTMSASIIKCPYCREDFGPFSLLLEEEKNSSTRETRAERFNQHLGCNCKKCHASPITGKCYKCSTCLDYHLCQTCFNTPTHQEHSFQYREKSNQRWKDASRGNGSTLPQAVVQNLLSRDISEDDYDMLLQLDGQRNAAGSDLTEASINSIPLERVRANGPLLAVGQQCRCCLRRYEVGQLVRRLPCRHKYHKECIDNWLLHQNPTCPADGTIFTNENLAEAKRMRQRKPKDHENQTNQQVNVKTSSKRAHASRMRPSIQRHNSLPNLDDLIVPGQAITRAVVPDQHLVRDEDIIELVNHGQELIRHRDAEETPIESAPTSIGLNGDQDVTDLFPLGLEFDPDQDDANLDVGPMLLDFDPDTGLPLETSVQNLPTNQGVIIDQSERISSGNAESDEMIESQQTANNAQLDYQTESENDHTHLLTGLNCNIASTNIASAMAKPETSSRMVKSVSSSRYPSSLESTMMAGQSFLINRGSDRKALSGPPNRSKPSSHQSFGPSIPSQRGNEQLVLEVGSTNIIDATENRKFRSKPPSGKGHGSKGKVRKKMPMRFENRTDQQNSSGLFVGQDPSTAQGFASNFAISRTVFLGSAKDRQRRNSKTDCGLDVRWGTMRELQGEANDIVLSGLQITDTIGDP